MICWLIGGIALKKLLLCFVVLFWGQGFSMASCFAPNVDSQACMAREEQLRLQRQYLQQQQMMQIQQQQYQQQQLEMQRQQLEQQQQMLKQQQQMMRNYRY